MDHQIRNLAITPSHEFLAVGTHCYNVYVFKHDGVKFNEFQKIIFSSYGNKFVSLTDDHQYLTVSDESGRKIHRYYYNEVLKKFVEFLNN